MRIIGGCFCERVLVSYTELNLLSTLVSTRFSQNRVTNIRNAFGQLTPNNVMQFASKTLIHHELKRLHKYNHRILLKVLISNSLIQR